MKTSKLLKVKPPSQRMKPEPSPEVPVRYVLVRTGETPIGLSTDAYDLLDVFHEAVGGFVEEVPYPPHLEGACKYVVLNHDAGLQARLPYNRWGIVGDFVVVGNGRNGWKGLSEEDVRCIEKHLTDSRGYLDERSTFENVFRGRPEPPSGWVPKA